MRIANSFAGGAEHVETPPERAFVYALIHSDMSRPYWNTPQEGMTAAYGVCTRISANEMWDPDIDPTLELADVDGWNIDDAYIFTDAAKTHLCFKGRG